MIKFIASDLDGTILQNKAQSVDESLFAVIEQLIDRGFVFAPASGRQCESLRRLFEPIKDKLMYIAENGALVTYKGEVIAKETIERDLANEIIRDVYEHENCEVLVSGEHTAYIKPKTEEYLHRMTKVVKYKTTIVDDFDSIDEDILKIAVCDLSGIEHSAEYFHKRWDGKVLVAVSGDQYLDFTDLKVNKGNAVRMIQKYLGITADECMAFGDNYNDVEMLKAVTNSYVMDNAVDEIKAYGRFGTDSVEKTLRELLAGKIK